MRRRLEARFVMWQEAGLIDTRQAAAIAGRSQATIRRWMTEGVVIRGRRVVLPNHKSGSNRWISNADLSEFLSMQQASVVVAKSQKRQLEMDPVSLMQRED